MATASPSTKTMPLPVELFYGAMERQIPLADYASAIDLHPDILRQALAGHLQGADPHPLSALAKAINRDPQQLDLTAAPCEESFGMWLKRNMEGITQHALRARAHLDSQTLKGFLNGALLPDSDQAERISRALYIDRLEIARVITANMAAASPSIASQQSPEPRASGRQSKLSAETGTSTTAGQAVTGARRRAAARQASAEPASPPPAVAPATSDETAAAMVEPDTPAAGLAPTAGKRVKRPSKPEAQLPAPTVTAMATHRPRAELASAPAAEAQEADPDAGPAPTAAPVDQGPQPAAQSARLKKARSRRQPDQAITSSPGALADAAQQTHALAEAQATAAGRPPAEFTAEEPSSTQASSRRRPKANRAPATDISAGGDAPSTFAADIAPSKPDERSADTSMVRTAPPVTAKLAADTATLQLSADEVRLIRHWRQLHPHGRRATLQYIGSLLVDD